MVVRCATIRRGLLLLSPRSAKVLGGGCVKPVAPPAPKAAPTSGRPSASAGASATASAAAGAPVNGRPSMAGAGDDDDFGYPEDDIPGLFRLLLSLAVAVA
jgi:hypothetical protein